MWFLIRNLYSDHISLMNRVGRKLLLTIDPDMTALKLNLSQKSFGNIMLLQKGLYSAGTSHSKFISHSSMSPIKESRTRSQKLV